MKKIIHSIIIISWLLAVSGYALELEIITEEYAPLNYMNKNDTKVKGFTTEVVRAILKETGNEHLVIKVYPWARAYRKIQKEPNVMVFSMARTKEREELFKWVGPIVERVQWLWKLKERTDIQIKTLEDAKKYSITIVPQSSVHEYLVTQGFSKKQFNFIHSGALSVEKFVHGRDDLHFDSKQGMTFRLKRLGKSVDIAEAILPLPNTGDYYLAFSLGTPDSTVILFQNALDALKSDGTYDRIFDKYLNN